MRIALIAILAIAGCSETTTERLQLPPLETVPNDYWIIDLGADYEYAVVGHPSRDYLWILSRTPTMDEATYEGILSRAKAKGYTLDPLQKTEQPPPAE